MSLPVFVKLLAPNSIYVELDPFSWVFFTQCLLGPFLLTVSISILMKARLCGAATRRRLIWGGNLLKSKPYRATRQAMIRSCTWALIYKLLSPSNGFLMWKLTHKLLWLFPLKLKKNQNKKEKKNLVNHFSRHVSYWEYFCLPL